MGLPQSHYWDFKRIKWYIIVKFAQPLNNDIGKYWKYQYFSIKFWVLSISIDISRTSVKSPSISIWRIKQYFPINTYWNIMHWNHDLPKKQFLMWCLKVRISRYALWCCVSRSQEEFTFKVHIFQEGYKNWQNLHCRFDTSSSEDFVNFCGLLRKYELN